MNDMTAIVTTLETAIQSLQVREAFLSPLEKVKLKSLRLNLAAAGTAVATPPDVPARRHYGPIPEPFETRFLSLKARSIEAHAQNCSLLDDLRLHSNRARWLERVQPDWKILQHSSARSSFCLSEHFYQPLHASLAPSDSSQADNALGITIQQTLARSAELITQGSSAKRPPRS